MNPVDDRVSQASMTVSLIKLAVTAIVIVATIGFITFMLEQRRRR